MDCCPPILSHVCHLLCPCLSRFPINIFFPLSLVYQKTFEWIEWNDRSAIHWTIQVLHRVCVVRPSCILSSYHSRGMISFYRTATSGPSVCPGLIIYFCNCCCPLLEGPKWICIGPRISTRHCLPSTDQNWQCYWSLKLWYWFWGLNVI